MHYGPDAIYTEENRKNHTCILELEWEDTADNPTSSKPEKVFKGPARIVYSIYPDGVNVRTERSPKLCLDALQEAMRRRAALGEDPAANETDEWMDRAHLADNHVRTFAEQILNFYAAGQIIIKEL